MSTNQRKTGRAARRVPTERFKTLEQQVQILKRRQLSRRLGKDYQETVDENGKKQITVVRLDKIAPVPVKRVLAPVVIPPRLDDDLEYVERKFPKAAKKRRMLNETSDEIERLREDLVALTKEMNLTQAKVTETEIKTQHQKRELENLLFQDDIMQQRVERGRKIQALKDRLQHSEEQAQELSRYTRTLKRMMERIWKEQVTYERTLDSYMQVLQAQKHETEEIEELARRMKYLRHVTQRKLVQKREELYDTEALRGQQLNELRQVARARESIAEQFAHMQNEQQKKLKQAQRNRASTKMLDNWQRSTNARKMQDVEQELEDLMDKFRRIELVTGLKTEAAIVHRYFHQDEYCREMEQKVIFLRGQIAKANARARKLRSLQDNDKYFGKAHQSSRQSQIEVRRYCLGSAVVPCVLGDSNSFYNCFSFSPFSTCFWSGRTHQ